MELNEENFGQTYHGMINKITMTLLQAFIRKRGRVKKINDVGVINEKRSFNIILYTVHSFNIILHTVCSFNIILYNMHSFNIILYTSPNWKNIL